MRLEQLRHFLAILDIDFTSLEEAYAATLLRGDALGVRFIGGKVEFEVIKHEMLYGNTPSMMIIDDLGPEPVWTESDEIVKSREQANRRTKEAKKPLPYYHGHKRRF